MTWFLPTPAGSRSWPHPPRLHPLTVAVRQGLRLMLWEADRKRAHG